MSGDQQCDFDELTALLSDSEDESQTKQNAPADEEGEDTSDDDIDDDELDKLALLVAEGASEVKDEGQPTKPGPVTSEQPTEEIPEPATTGEAASTKQQEITKMAPVKSSKIVEEGPTSSKSVSSGAKDEEDPLSMMEELRKMRERVQQLESQLKKTSPPAQASNQPAQAKAAPSPAPQKSSQPKGPPSAASVHPASTTKKPSPTDSAVPKKVAGTPHSHSTGAGPRVLKDLEVDLFGTESPMPPLNSSPPQRKEVLPIGKAGSSPAPVSSSYRPGFYKEVNGEAKAKVEDDDSDWDDMDGEGGSHLSKEGQELNKLIKIRSNRGERTAHTPSYNVNQLQGRKPTWGSKAPEIKRSSSAVAANKDKIEVDDPNVSRDPYSGIRIINPLVSSTQMRVRMENRRVVKMSTIHQKTKASLEGDWVTMGVIVVKSDPKTSQKGKQFSIWTLSDLVDCDHPVKMFLFGETHKAHWKTSVGSVVGLLNPNLMQNNEKYQNKSDEICITVDHPQKVMIMGTSKDFGYCKAKTKAGRACIQFINKQQGEFCAYHVQNAYKKLSAKRSELQASHTGVTPRSFEKKVLGNSLVMYGGQSFGASAVPTKKASKVSAGSLLQHGSTVKANKVTTLSLHSILPEDVEKLKKAELGKEKAEKNKAFHEMLVTPTCGSLNLVKHIMKSQGASPGVAPSEKAKAIKQMSAKELLKQHQSDLDQRRLDYRLKQQQKQKPLTGPVIDLDEPVPGMTTRPADPLQCMPKLGRGFSGGPLRQQNKSSALDKKKAIFLVQSSGGIKKEDPNSVRKSSSDETKDAIKKRVLEQKDRKDSSSSGGEEPPKKKSRLLGDLDLDDPDVQKLLKAKSKHANKLTEMEEEKQEAYFSLLEKKEAMEQKMASTFQIKCTAVTCRQCNYKALSALQTCREQRHHIQRIEAVKRFFSCKDCKRRTYSLERYPTRPCEGCGGRSFEKAPMMKEKKGPKMPSEELLLRGEEIKFLNSTQ